MSERFHYVYILVCLADDSLHYVGVTADLEARLGRHNAGACPHTSKHRPWRIETAIAFRQIILALKPFTQR